MCGSSIASKPPGALPRRLLFFKAEHDGEISDSNFGELLVEHLSGVPQDAYPYLLSQLERTAAAHYRAWTDDVPEHRDGILECSAREDEIADRVEAMFPFLMNTVNWSQASFQR